MIDFVHQTRRFEIVGVGFDLIDYDNAIERIDHLRSDGAAHYVTLTNPYCVTLCRTDSGMRRAVEMADLTLPDGVGITIAARLNGYPHRGRVAGPNLMLKLCDWGRKYNYRHYFYGGAEGIAEKLADRLIKIYPGLIVAGTYCPPFRQLTEEEDRAVVEQINRAKPDIVWVGLGAPKQEKWMAEHQSKIKGSVLIGVGRAFDFNSGNFKRAPELVCKLGLEWLHCNIFQPRRTLPKFGGLFAFGIRAIGQCARRRLRPGKETVRLKPQKTSTPHETAPALRR